MDRFDRFRESLQSSGAPYPSATRENEQKVDTRNIGTLSKSSRRLIEADERLRRELWRAARDFRQSDYYDHSLFGLSLNLDQAVGRHQREAMLYNQGEFNQKCK